MNTNRILKEARPLFWPWCVVSVLSVLPIFRPERSHAWIGPSAIFLGVCLLASLGFGLEFQNRTLPLLLAQPIDRMKIWREKIVVSTMAAATAALIFAIAAEKGGSSSDAHGWPLAAVIFIALTASATYWTLLAGSTVGGCILNIAVYFAITFALTVAYWLCGARDYWTMSPTFPIVSASVFLTYAGVMLWLGRRALRRFQATGGMAGDDLLTVGPNVIPRALTGWLRCRPSEAVLNLFRKEIYLLRPVWLISIVTLLGWACLPLLKSHPLYGTASYLELAGVSLGAISTLMIAILAGTISLGEERTSGTHAWHMTLPIPALLQWRVKLYMALLASFLGAWLLPVLITRNLRIPDDRYMGLSLTTAWLLGVLILTFASFWCACAVKGTVRAALSVLPALIVLSLASGFGIGAGPKFEYFLVSQIHPFANFRFTDTIVSMVYPRSNLSFLLGLWYNEENTTQMLLVLSIPTLILALVLSYRLFRTQVRDGAFSLLRNLLPLLVIAFLSTFAFLLTLEFVRDAWQQDWHVFNETRGAIMVLQNRSQKLDGTHPVQLKLDDLGPLSETTRHWLHGSSITIAPLSVLPSQVDQSRNSMFRPWNPNDRRPWYLTTIRMAGGARCAETYPEWDRTFNMLFVVCK